MKGLYRLFLILTIIWMAVIFIFSSQNGALSSSTSGFFTGLVIDIFVPDFDAYDAIRQDEIMNMTSLIIRKTAHFAEFAILSCLSFMTALTKLWSWRTDNYISIHTKQARSDIFKSCRLRSFLWAIIFSSIYAVTDEFHQGFVDGRAPAITDVLIDCCGALFGALLITLIISRFYYKKYKVKRKKLPG